VSAISEKICNEADRLLDEDPYKLRAAIEALVAKAEGWQESGMPFSALGDEILLTLGRLLGLRLEIGKYAQLVDLDEEMTR
jgi:hypothetical protein